MSVVSKDINFTPIIFYFNLLLPLHLMKTKQIFENVEIIDISSEGKGVCRVNNIVCFVDFTVPGDIVDIEITRKKSNYREAKTIRFQKYSDKRTEPVCSHFGVCGGCKWQNLSYDTQLVYKQKYVADALHRIGGINFSNTLLMPILPSKNNYFYRNKLEFTFSNKRWLSDLSLKPDTWNPGQNALGFHIPKFFDKVLDIDKCFLQEDFSNQIRLAVKGYALEHNLSFFDLRKQEGLLRNLIIRNTTIGQWMVIVVFYYDDKTIRTKLLDYLHSNFPQITSLQYVINSKPNDSIADQQARLYKGQDSIMEVMGDLKFRISPKSFFQTNSLQATALYKTVLEFAELSQNEMAYDLYTGTGTIANFVAHQAKRVIGIEYINDAIEDAKINSELNKISNTQFFAGDIKDILTNEFCKEHENPNVIITDPPRAGMHPDVVARVLDLSPERIIYVSCNPATQARDVALLSTKYSVEKVQPVDMFPHTTHVESVAKLIQK